MRSKPAHSTIDIVLPVIKPAGWTSFDVVKKIRGLFGVRKVGHAGTLDPFATGLLLICLGRATRKVPELMQLEKEYVAQVKLGEETDTLDPTGKIVQSKPVPLLTPEQIQSVLRQFEGTIEQEVPAYSAVKVNGQRLYKLARKGQTVPRVVRTARIYGIELLTLQEQGFTFRVVCGRGTYVRALARDMARALGTVGYLAALERTRIGAYTVQKAYTIQQLENTSLLELSAEL
ncbi:MAG: tRNA pseudouridine(55) synthase TruB [Calditrichaeota bacterium]|nr:MAG: tRNA pseudouridine(55) synthase TruB [Calditrichota bacterium]